MSLHSSSTVGVRSFTFLAIAESEVSAIRGGSYWTEARWTGSGFSTRKVVGLRMLDLGFRIAYPPPAAASS